MKKKSTQSNGQKLTLSFVLTQLLKGGIISKQQHNHLSQTHRSSGKESQHPLILIANQTWQSRTRPTYLLSLEVLTQWLAEITRQTYFRIDPLKINVQKITAFISQSYATKLQILPIEATDHHLIIAICDPFSSGWESEIEKISNLKVKRVLINPQDLKRYLVELYSVSRSISGALSSKTNTAASSFNNFEQMISMGKAGEPDANDHHIISIVDWLLQFAFEQGASDIHIEPRREKGQVRFRIDGILHTVHEYPSSIGDAITGRMKSLSRMDVTDRRRPQDGRIKTVTPAGKEIEMRLSTMPTAFGEKLVLRIFDPDVLIRDFSELGFGSHEASVFKSLIINPNGIILVTGPTGSGKTTTLYSSLNQIARPEINVCTIEDPIEMIEPKFNQMQVQPSIDVNFASGVRTLLRQDPDIIMVGEIRDRETADISIQAALTGHLVLSSLHTNDAPSSVTRLLDIGILPYIISATLLGVLSQRLIRTLCRHCRISGEIDKKVWEKFVHPFELAPPKKSYVANGCGECRKTGYLGRIGIYEMLLADKNIRKQIINNSDLEILRNTAIKHGMRPLKINGAQKIIEGITTIEEVYSVLPQKG